MTRRHYTLLANALRREIDTQRDPALRQGAQNAAIRIADEFGDCDFLGNFNRRRFLDACGLEHAE